MRNPLVSSLLGALVGGAVGTSVTLALAPASVTEKPVVEKSSSSAGVVESDEREDDEEEAQSDEAARISKLEHRLALLNRALAQRTPGADDALGDAPFPEGATDVADPVFEAAVLDIVDREQERKTEEQESYRKELRVVRSRRFASSLTETLGLSEDEQEKIAAITTEYFESFGNLRNSPDRPVTRREWREQAAELNALLEKKLKEAMGPEQYEKYEALPREDQIGFGPPRGRRSTGGGLPGSGSPTNQRGAQQAAPAGD